MTDRVLPALFVFTIVRKSVHDELINAVKRDSLVWWLLDRHGYQCDVGIRGFHHVLGWMLLVRPEAVVAGCSCRCISVARILFITGCRWRVTGGGCSCSGRGGRVHVRCRRGRSGCIAGRCGTRAAIVRVLLTKKSVHLEGGEVAPPTEPMFRMTTTIEKPRDVAAVALHHHTNTVHLRVRAHIHRHAHPHMHSPLGLTWVHTACLPGPTELAPRATSTSWLRGNASRAHASCGGEARAGRDLVTDWSLTGQKTHPLAIWATPGPRPLHTDHGPDVDRGGRRAPEMQCPVS